MEKYEAILNFNDKEYYIYKTFQVLYDIDEPNIYANYKSENNWDFSIIYPGPTNNRLYGRAQNNNINKYRRASFPNINTYLWGKFTEKYVSPMQGIIFPPSISQKTNRGSQIPLPPNGI